MLDNPKRVNNFAQKPRRITNFKLTFPTLPSLLKEPRKVELYQKTGNHDVMVVTFTTTGQLWFDEIQTGVPIRFDWDQGMVKSTWFGYVSSISKTVATQRERIMEVHCVGSSFPLKERAARTFTNVTIPEAAQQIASEYGLGFIGDSHPRRFAQLMVAGHSYWEWLQEQAKRIGFAAYVDNNILYFKEFDSVINEQSHSVPILFSDSSSALYRGQYNDKTLDFFRVMKSEYAEDTDVLRTEKTVGGIDVLTGELITTSVRPDEVGDGLRRNVGDVLFSEYRTDQVITSYSDAQSVSKGAANLARFKLPAMVKCAGDPRLKPYAPVRILGTGELTDGFWIVREVTHTFQKFGDYNIDAVIVTDGTGNNNITAFRKNSPSYMSTVNIDDRINNPQTNFNLSTFLDNKAPQVLPKEQGLKRSPALWTTIQRSA